MKKSFFTKVNCCSLFVGFILAVSACSTQPPASQVQTAVAGTLAAVPAQPAQAVQVVEVTRVQEVTKVVEVKVTSTLDPNEKATATATSQPEGISEATATVEAQAASTDRKSTRLNPVTDQSRMPSSA